MTREVDQRIASTRRDLSGRDAHDTPLVDNDRVRAKRRIGFAIDEVPRLNIGRRGRRLRQRDQQCGITRVAIPGTPWATYVRIAQRQYVGLARFRHLEETADE